MLREIYTINTLYRTIVLIIITFFCNQNTRAETISQVIEDALKDNIKLSAAYDDLQSKELSLGKQLQYSLPTVVFNLAAAAEEQKVYEKDKVTSPTTSKTITTDGRQLQLNISQNVFNGMKTPRTIDKIKIQKELAHLRYKFEKKTTIISVVSVYLELLKSRANALLSHDVYNTLLKTKNSIKKKLQVGEASATDLSTAEEQLINARSSMIRADFQFEVISAKYNRIIGHYPQNPDETDQDFLLKILITPLGGMQEIVSVAQKNDLQIKESLQSKNIAMLDYAIAQGDTMPSVDISFNNIFKDGTSSQKTGTHTGQQTTFTISLYKQMHGFADIKGMQSAYYNMQKLSKNHRDQLLILEEKAITAWSNFKIAEADIMARTESVKNAEKILENTTASYNAGSLIELDIMKAKNALSSAKISYLDAVTKGILARYDLALIMDEDISNQGLIIPKINNP